MLSHWRSLAICSVVNLILLPLILSATGADPDLFHRLAAGKLAVQLAEVSTADPFAFTPKLPQWIDHEWLSGVLFFLLYERYGDAGLLLLRLFCFVGSIFFLALAGRSLLTFTKIEISPLLQAVLLLLCSLHGIFAFTSAVRCQVFTYLFLPILFYSLLSYLNSKSKLCVLAIPLLFALWCNLHGGFVLGLVTFAFFIGLLNVLKFTSLKSVLFLSAILLCSVAATAVNPYGFGTYWQYLYSALTMQRATISEWAPLWSDPSTFVATVVLLTPIIAGISFTRTKVQILCAALVLFSIYVGVTHSRLLIYTMQCCAIFGLPFLSILSLKFDQRFTRLLVPLRRVSSAALAVLCLIALERSYSLIKNGTPLTLSLKDYPVNAVSFLSDSKESGELFVDFNTGGYALWKLYPNFKISMDGRYETVYPESTHQMNGVAFAIGSDDGLKAFLEINPSHALLPNSQYIRENLVRLGEKWRVVFSDQKSMIITQE